jgi:hypothetical protein
VRGGGKFTVNCCKFTCSVGLKGFQFRIGARNFRSHSLDVFLVLFGSFLQVKDFFVAIGGHLRMRGVGEGKWIHKKIWRNDIYDSDHTENRDAMG